MRIVAAALVAACAVFCGCARVAMAPLRAPENSMYQELLAESVRRQVTRFELGEFRDRKVHVDVAHVFGPEGLVETGYVRHLLTHELHRVGAYVVADEAEADLMVVCLVNVSGLRIGSASFPPGWFFYILPLSHTREVTGRASAELRWRQKGAPEKMGAQKPPAEETTYQETYVFGLGPFRSSR
jgi:hypothetical protein